jgi:hypothetical protein
VLEGLRGKASQDAGEVTWSRLADYVQENVEARVPEWLGAGARQVPNEVRNLAGRSPVLVRLDAGVPPGSEKPRRALADLGNRRRPRPGAGRLL